MSQSQIALTFGAGFSWQETALGVKQQVKGSAPTVYKITIDNTANQNLVYFKGWFAVLGSVTVGTTAPNFCLPAPANKKVTYLITGPGGIYGTGLTVAMTTTPGTPGTAVPVGAVKVRIAYT